MLYKNKYHTILTLFFFSGLTGLIYEAVWARFLSLIFGSTVYASSTILVAYMAGLSIGSFFGGRAVERMRNPVRFYGICELGIGLCAVILPIIFVQMNGLSRFIHTVLSPSRVLYTMLRFIIVTCLLLIPTSLMGATLPSLSKGLSGDKRRAGSSIGYLYTINTMGAVCGVLVATFMSIEKLGLRYSSFFAALVNIAIGSAILFLMDTRDYSTKTREVDTNLDTLRRLPFNARLVLLVYAISGFCALSLEVLWTRELVFFLGTGTYAFGTMLSVFLLGIGLGSLIISRLLQKIERPLLLLGILEVCIGVTTLLNFILIPKLYSYKQDLFSNLGQNLFSFVLSGYAVTIGLMIIPTLFMGGAFPLAVQVYSGESKKIGQSVGKIYAFNTIGSILGALLTGFLFIPLIGIAPSFKMIIIINILIGGAVLFFSNFKYIFVKYITVGLIPLIIATLLFLPFDQPLVLYSYIMNDPDNRLLHYAEDAYASVSVIDIPGTGRRLYVDSGLAADTSRFDMPSHKMIVHVPLLLMDNPKKALVVGFGMGETSHSITTHGVQVDAVEISRGAVEANHYFKDVNRDILNNKLFNITIDDGRNYLLTHDGKYDLISVGIIHPGISSNSAGFYGIDFYELCRQRLTDTGIISQWVPTHGLSLEAFKVIISTFLQVFPHASLWFKYTDNFVILLGSKTPVAIDFVLFLKGMDRDGVMDDLATVDMTNPLVILDSFWMDEKSLAEFAAGAGITSDDRPRLEFMSVRSVNDIGIDTVEALKGSHQRVTDYLTNIRNRKQVAAELSTIYEATEHLIQGQIYYKKYLFDESIAELRKSLDIYPDDDNTRYLLDYTTQTYRNKLLIRAEESYKEGMIPEALGLYMKAAEIKPDSAETHNFIGMCYSKLGDYSSAIRAVEKALLHDPDNYQYHFNLASLFALTANYDESRAELEKTLQLNPDSVRAREALQQLNEFLDNQ